MSPMAPWLETDVLVIGAGAAGWPAAIGAARAGARVVLLDDDPYPGGAAVDQFVSMPDGGPRSGIVAEYLAQLERRFPRPSGHVQMAYPETRPYGVPYRALVPRHLDGLLIAGKHLSGSHLAMASYRVQCLLGQLGQAAGVAAARCAQRQVAPRQLAFADLRPQLLAPPQRLVNSADTVVPPREQPPG